MWKNVSFDHKENSKSVKNYFHIVENMNKETEYLENGMKYKHVYIG